MGKCVVVWVCVVYVVCGGREWEWVVCGVVLVCRVLVVGEWGRWDVGLDVRWCVMYGVGVWWLWLVLYVL